jgi:hypothetical protein
MKHTTNNTPAHNIPPHPRVLLDHARHVAPALLHVALDAARQAHVVVGVYVDLHVEVVPQRCRVVQHQDPFHDDHVGRLHPPHFVRAPAVRDEIVYGHLDRAAGFQRQDRFKQHFGVKRLGRVKVVVADVGALLLRQGPVERVMRYERHGAAAEAAHDGIAHRGLARCGAACRVGFMRLLCFGAP